MNFTGEQVNNYGPEPRRLFTLDASLFGLPVDVLHTYLGATANMRVKACSLAPMMNLSGPEMDQSETVTVFNDLCLLAPAALIGAPVAWLPIDADRVRGTFTNGAYTVTAELVFNPDNELVDFLCDDRQRASKAANHLPPSGGPPPQATIAPSTPAGTSPTAKADGTPPRQKEGSPTSSSTSTRPPTTQAQCSTAASQAAGRTAQRWH